MTGRTMNGSITWVKAMTTPCMVNNSRSGAPITPALNNKSFSRPRRDEGRATNGDHADRRQEHQRQHKHPQQEQQRREDERRGASQHHSPRPRSQIHREHYAVTDSPGGEPQRPNSRLKRSAQACRLRLIVVQSSESSCATSSGRVGRYRRIADGRFTPPLVGPKKYGVTAAFN